MVCTCNGMYPHEDFCGKPEIESVGYQCAACRWTTTDGSEIGWPTGGVVELLCPDCGAYGQFIDYYGDGGRQ